MIRHGYCMGTSIRVGIVTTCLSSPYRFITFPEAFPSLLHILPGESRVYYIGDVFLQLFAQDPPCIKLANHSCRYHSRFPVSPWRAKGSGQWAPFLSVTVRGWPDGRVKVRGGLTGGHLWLMRCLAANDPKYLIYGSCIRDSVLLAASSLQMLPAQSAYLQLISISIFFQESRDVLCVLLIG